MNCECNIDMHIDDYWNIISKKYPIARIQHVCSECKKIIYPKEKYLKETLTWCGEISTIKICLTCENIRDIFFCNWIYGDLIEALNESIRDNGGEIPEYCISELTSEAREIVCDKIDEYFNYEENRKHW